MENGAAIAFFAFLAFIFWLGSRTQEQDASRRYELYRAMVEHPGPGADAVRQLLETEERRSRHLLARSTNVGGLVVTTVGVLLTLFLISLRTPEPVYFLGLMPLAVGVIMLVTGWRARNDESAADR